MELVHRGDYTGPATGSGVAAGPVSSHKTIHIASGAENVDGKRSVAEFL
jgi:hypothetical protein